MRAHGSEYSLSAAYKVTALRIIMTCRREQFEFMERESRSLHNDKVCDAMFETLYGKIREYAQQRKLD